MAVQRDDGRAAESRRLDANEPGRIVFRENLDVLALRRPQPMQHDAARTMAFVLLDIEERARIARPDDIAGRAADAVGEVLLAHKVANRDGENSRAEIVGAPREFGVVGRMARAGQLKKRLALGTRVAVDQHRLRDALARVRQ